MRHAGNCRRCEQLATTRKHIVWGEGPTPCHVMFVGEAPGKMEDRLGTPFVERAPAGGEFTMLAQRNHVPRHSSYVTNIVKCHPPDDRDPTPEEITACDVWLQADVMAASPRFIVCIGRTATRHFLGDVSMEDVHGLPFQLTTLGGITIIPVYHPAAGLHSPSTMIMVHEDFRAVGEIVRGVRSRRHITDAYPTVDYRIVGSPAEVAEDMAALGGGGVVGVDTESTSGGIWSVQYSTTPGVGRLVWADDDASLQLLGAAVADSRVTTVIANALYDLPLLEGIGIRPATVVDTMLAAYLLQSEPKGLKPLAYRHCGMAMTDYSDMVRPATHMKAMRYLAQAVEVEWPDPEPVLTWNKGRPHVKRPQNIGRKIASILTAASKDDDAADPRKRWMSIKADEGRGMVEDILGPMPVGDLSDIPLQEAVYYACRDPDAVLRVYPLLWERIVECGLESTFWADMRAMAMVSDMMVTGIRGDRAAFADLSRYLQEQYDGVLDDLMRRLHVMGIHVDVLNPASPPQVASLLYDRDRLNLSPYLRGVKGADKTDNKILSRLVEMRPTIGDAKANIVGLIQDCRGYIKLKGTYADPMPSLMDANDRIHTTFRITSTATGRLSASSPNLMAFPVRSEDGRRIRNAFVAGDGCTLVSADYSAVELRVLAHCANDPVMIDIFCRGLDMHSETASHIFGIPVENIDSNLHRRPSKTCTFGTVYGMQGEGLQATLATMGLMWSLQKCEDFIKEWFKLYKGVKVYMDAVHDHARRYGWVADMFGRRRWVPNAQSRNKRLQAEALRESGNHPIQSGAQGIIKRAMGDLVPVYRDIRKEGIVMNPLLQIHDDLLFECCSNSLTFLIPLIQWHMEKAVYLKVPVSVDVKTGSRWGAMTKWKENA